MMDTTEVLTYEAGRLLHIPVPPVSQSSTRALNTPPRTQTSSDEFTQLVKTLFYWFTHAHTQKHTTLNTYTSTHTHTHTHTHPHTHMPP